LHDRFRGAFGTCGELFADTRARVEAGELVVESPQVAAGYLLPGGVFEPFDGRARTGDAAEFDERGRLRVIGKVSDRITLTNGLNYNPLIIEARIAERDLERGNLLEEAVVVGDGQPRLGCVFFLRDPAAAGGSTRRYLEALIRDVNSTAAVDERIGPWAIHAEPLRESPYLGPSGKIRRAAVERAYQTLYRETALHPTA
jgi:long-subunit acyl-CoA synthetase (AMP-forming)